MRCDCVNLKHSDRCWQTAKWKCTECGDQLCGGCKKNHHAHDKFEKIEQVPSLTQQQIDNWNL